MIAHQEVISELESKAILVIREMEYLSEENVEEINLVLEMHAKRKISPSQPATTTTTPTTPTTHLSEFVGQ